VAISGIEAVDGDNGIASRELVEMFDRDGLMAFGGFDLFGSRHHAVPR
jgi:hypothetical protein